MLTAIDLCAGIGGFHLAGDQLGINFVYANDFEPTCQYTYDLNFGAGSLHVQDLCSIGEKDIPSHDLLCAGFPCQPFSMAGKKDGFNDPRSGVFFKIVSILKYHQPKYFILENVKNLKTHDKGNSIKRILACLTDTGYHVHSEILRSYDFGIPQNRERLFLIGIRQDLHDVNLFSAIHRSSDKGLPSTLIEAHVDDKYYYHTDSTIYPKLVEDITKDINTQTIYQFRRHYVRENKNELCPTLTANMGTGGHNVPIILDTQGYRKLTPRECLRFQGYPESYKLPQISDSHLYKQIGNSVTVPVIKAIMCEILSHLSDSNLCKTRGKIKLVLTKKVM